MKELTLTNLFILDEDRILLALKKRGFGEGKWNGVGGKIEPGETIEQALVRECQEEIGITPKQPKHVGKITFDEIHDDERKLMHVHIYTANNWVGSIQETEEMRPQWFNKNAIPYDQMWDDDKFWLPQILEGKMISAEFTIGDDGQVIKHTVSEVKSLDRIF